MSKPILYSFRRCPRAMRARIALMYAEVDLELREVYLKNKPQAMLQVSPKGTVPVLVLPNGKVIDESYDVMLWAIEQHDPDHWGEVVDHPLLHAPLQQLLKAIRVFKYQENDAAWQTNKLICKQWLKDLNNYLKDGFLTGNQCRLVDAALFPLIRQVSKVDVDWFASLQLQHVQQWLQYFYNSDFFERAMQKYPVWEE